MGSEEVLRDPLGLSQSALSDAVCSGAEPQRERVSRGVRERLSEQLKSGQLRLEDIPDVVTLGPEGVRPGRLVRARGMVQDMLGSEVYADAMRLGGVWYSLTYHEAPNRDEFDRAEDTILSDRSILHVVPPPGETSWVKARRSSMASFTQDCLACGGTTCSTEMASESSPCAIALSGHSTGVPSGTKRVRLSDQETAGENADDHSVPMDSLGWTSCSENLPSSTDAKKPRAAESDEQHMEHDSGSGKAKGGRHDAANEAHFMPHGSISGSSTALYTLDGIRKPSLGMSYGDGFPMLAKVYNADDEPKLNEVAEFIGVLSAPQPGDGEAASEDADFPTAEEARSPPHSQVPRLHCIMVVPERSTPPLEQTELEPSALADHIPPRQEQPRYPHMSGESVKASAIEDISAALGGDEVAAEHVMLALTAKVHARPNDMALGKLPLNLMGAPENGCVTVSDASKFSTHGTKRESVASALAKTLSRFVPRVMHIELTIDGLNRCEWTPKKDHDADRLRSGMLQLPTGTVIVADETTLEPGTLYETGVNNCKALATIMDTQRLEYDFGFYSLPQEANLQVIVVSSARTFLAPDAIVQLSNPNNSSFDSVPQRDQETLGLMRSHLSAARTLVASITMEDEVCKKAEQDMVEARKADSNTGQDTFHKWLTLARLSAASARREVVSVSDWERARTLSSKQRNDPPASERHKRTQQQQQQQQ